LGEEEHKTERSCFFSVVSHQVKRFSCCTAAITIIFWDLRLRISHLRKSGKFGGDTLNGVPADLGQAPDYNAPSAMHNRHALQATFIE